MRKEAVLAISKADQPYQHFLIAAMDIVKIMYSDDLDERVYLIFKSEFASNCNLQLSRFDCYQSVVAASLLLLTDMQSPKWQPGRNH